MFYLLTFLWCLPSPILWFFNAEAWVVGNAAAGRDPIALAIVATASQLVTFCVLFRGGDALLERLPRVRARIEKLDLPRYRKAGYALLGAGAILGVPPLVLLSLVARTLHYRFAWFFAIAVVGRLGRFAVLAFAPDTFRALFGAATGS